MSSHRVLLNIPCAILALIALVACHAPAFAAEPLTMKLWPGDAPGVTGDEKPEESKTSGPPKVVTRVSNVSVPTLTVYQPPKEKANGACVVIAPGGGYHILAWDLEGIEIAEWFNSFGVTAVLLKYRVPHPKRDRDDHPPLQDAQRAVRLTRKHAKQWHIDPNRIGMLGFSAGGHLTVATGTQSDNKTYEPVDAADELSAKPNFLMPIYAAYLGDPKDDTKLDPDLKIDKDTPPMFLAVTLDDKMRGLHAGLLLAELKKAGVPAEAHIYTKGGHGYGLRPSDDPVSGWPKLAEQWMRSMGLLAK